MQGYGRSRWSRLQRPRPDLAPRPGRPAQQHGPRRRWTAVALAGVALLAVSSCSLLEQASNTPSAIVIPGTNAPSTETVPSTLPATATGQTRASRSYTVAEGHTYRRVISDAPIVGLGAFHVGATTATGERMDGVSGVHFSTPDRSVRCSTGNNGANALVCAGEQVTGRVAPPPGSPAGCAWDRGLAVLSASGATAGGCGNLYPVLYRSHILEYDAALRAGSFSCLNDVSGLYCLNSDSNEGFALTRDGFQQINGDERVPDSLTSGGRTGDNPHTTSTPAATPTR